LDNRDVNIVLYTRHKKGMLTRYMTSDITTINQMTTRKLLIRSVMFNVGYQIINSLFYLNVRLKINIHVVHIAQMLCDLLLRPIFMCILTRIIKL
jgi:hypothetical protein